MRRFRVLALGLVAGCALGAFAAAGASAQGVPTWYECRKLVKVGHSYGGHYKNRTCTETATPGKGKYELQEGVGYDRHFKGKGGPAVLHLALAGGAVTIECASSKNSAVPKLPNLEISVEVTYSKCTRGAGTELELCTSPNAPLNKKGKIERGKIVFRNMKAELGYTTASSSGVGLKIESASGTGVLTEFACELRKGVRGTKPKSHPTGVYTKIEGRLIGAQMSNVGVVSPESTVVAKAESPWAGTLVNILGFSEELGAIENHEQPANVLEAELCGKAVEEMTNGETCVDPPAGEEQTTTYKGEALMIKS